MRVRSLLAVVSMGTLVAGGMAWSGCGGGSDTGVDGGPDGMGGGGSGGKGGTAGSGGSTGSGQGGSAGSGGAKGAGGSKGTGGSGGSAGEGGTKDGGGGKEGGGVGPNCPTTPCPSGDSCCANVAATDAAAAFTCSTSCAADDTLGCLESTDCPGQVCCVTAVFKAGAPGATIPTCLETDITSASSACVAKCAQDITLSCAAATDLVQLCATKADCTDKSYPDCCQVNLGGETYSGCLPALAKLGGLTCD
jgi:hypothetical protein